MPFVPNIWDRVCDVPQLGYTGVGFEHGVIKLRYTQYGRQEHTSRQGSVSSWVLRTFAAEPMLRTTVVLTVLTG